MAKIGCKHLVVAPITNYADGAVPTYGAKTLCPYLVSVNTNYEHADVEMYGDDMVRESANMITGYTAGMSLTDLDPETGAAFLAGWEKDGENYALTDANAREVGWGYVGCGMKNGVKYYDGLWHWRAQFRKEAFNANTKEKSITFNPDEISGKGFAIIKDTTGKEHFVSFNRFATEAEAIAFVESHLPT